MTNETIIKSALKGLVKMQIEEGSVGFAVDNDPDHDCCWDDVLTWIEESHQLSWIPVSEKLPEDGQSVLFCDIDNDIMLGYHIKGRPNTHFSQDGTFGDTKDVIAWMPLPEPYIEELMTPKHVMSACGTVSMNQKGR